MRDGETQTRRLIEKHTAREGRAERRTARWGDIEKPTKRNAKQEGGQTNAQKKLHTNTYITINF